MATAHKSETVMQVTDLCVDFWVDGQLYPAATHVSFEVARGETLAIVGESGSGKSTSAMALLGLLPDNSRTSGSVKLLGKEILGLRSRDLREIRGKTSP